VTHDRRLFKIATTVLTDGEFDVLISKHVHGHGRRTGSRLLRISEDAWRHRLASAERKLLEARKEKAA
jgi:hypothetical protein